MRFTVTDALRQLPGPAGARFVTLTSRGRLTIELYAPRVEDPQSPHRQDAVYVVVQGSGTFLNAGRREAFGPGGLLFVPAGGEHRFLDFGDDLAVWVIFYGPDGGEVPQG